MKKSFDSYTLLAGRGGRGGSLWEGEDHLLYIEPSGFPMPLVERYRRFDFDKIQSLTVTGNNRRAHVGLASGLLLALCLIAVAVALILGNFGSAGVFVVLAAPLVAAFIINLRRGRSCASRLQTAVGMYTLKPVNRFPVADKVRSRVRELAAREQRDILVSSLSPGQLAQGTAIPQTASPLREKKPWEGTRFFLPAVLCSIAAGVAVMADLFVDGVIFTVVEIMLALAAAVCMLLTLGQTRKQQAPGGMRPVLILLLLLLLVTGCFGYGLFIYSAAQNLESGGDPMLPLRAFTSASVGIFGPLAWVWIGFGGLIVLCSLAVLPAAINGRPVAARRPSSAPSSPSEKSDPPSASNSPPPPASSD